MSACIHPHIMQEASNFSLRRHCCLQSNWHFSPNFGAADDGAEVVKPFTLRSRAGPDFPHAVWQLRDHARDVIIVRGDRVQTEKQQRYGQGANPRIAELCRVSWKLGTNVITNVNVSRSQRRQYDRQRHRTAGWHSRRGLRER